MLNFYQIVKDNLSFNRFQYKETVCLEYTCPIDAEQIGIFSRNDYVVHVLSGKKTYKTIDGEWTLGQGETLYIKKGAELIQQYFDDEYCMLAFFISDDLIRDTYKEVRGVTASSSSSAHDFSAASVNKSEYLEAYFSSMLMYFRGVNRPPDHIMVLKLKELLISLMNSDPRLTSYFSQIAESSRPSLSDIMEKNFCYNLPLEEYADLTHRSLSTFKREFKEYYGMTPGRWLTQRRAKHAAQLLANTNTNISQVAFECGFEDVSHFSRVFKTNFGCSPSEYKNSTIRA